MKGVSLHVRYYGMSAYFVIDENHDRDRPNDAIYYYDYDGRLSV